MHTVAIMHCTVDTVVCMYRAWTQHTEFAMYKFIWGDICTSICLLLHLCNDVVHTWSLLQADLPDAPVRTCEGAFGYSQSVVQFKPCEWTLPTRLTVWCPWFDLCTYIGGWQRINYSWFMVWGAETLVIEYKLKPTKVTACVSFQLVLGVVVSCAVLEVPYLV